MEMKLKTTKITKLDKLDSFGNTTFVAPRKRGLKGKSNPAYKHGLRHMKEYAVWMTMKQRCLNQNSTDYPSYGGRGIKVCDRWLESFVNFYNDMGNCPATYSLDRLENDGHYSPENCEWRSGKYQCNHTRKNVHLSLNGKTQTISQWSDELGVGYSTLHGRKYRLKWSDEKILTTPVL